MTLSAVPADGEAPWPEAGERPIAFLVDASSSMERRLVGQWIDRHRPEAAEYRVCAVPPSRRRRRKRSVGAALTAVAASDSDPLLVPLRVAWLGPRRKGRRIPQLVDLLTLGDPRDPNRLLQELFVRFRPDRIRVVAGDAAPLSALRQR